MKQCVYGICELLSVTQNVCQYLLVTHVGVVGEGSNRIMGIIGTGDSAVIRKEVKRILTTGLTVV